jgi:hypothetical protein
MLARALSLAQNARRIDERMTVPLSCPKVDL